MFVTAPMVARAEGGPSAHAGYGPFTDHSRGHAVSAPLRSLAAEPASPGPTRDLPLGRHTKATSAPAVVADGALQSRAGTVTAATATSFDGVSNIDSVIPADPNGAVGPNHYVQWVNLHFEVFNKNGTAATPALAGSQLWSSLNDGYCSKYNDGDPIVRYDRATDRWLLAQFAFKTNVFGNPIAPYFECIAVSKTGDPTGAYNLYAVSTKDTSGHDYFPDYPKFGVWPDGYYMTVNYFNGNAFAGAAVFAFDAAAMRRGDASVTYVHSDLPSNDSLLPADQDGATAPPAGSSEYLASVDETGQALLLWKLHFDVTTPANSTLSAPAVLPTAAFNASFACSGNPDCVPQPGTNRKLDTLNDRLMYRLVYRNFGDHEALVVNQSVNVATSGDHAAVRWYEIRNPGGAPTIYQQGSYAPDSTNRWMGSAAFDKAGDIAIAYSASSSSTYPSIRFTGRTPTDSAGQMTYAEATIMAGSGSQTGYSRWGDYTSLTVDPVDDCTFWYTNEYLPASASYQWRTRIGHFALPNCSGGAVTPTAPSAPQSLAAAPRNAQVDLSWSPPANTGGSTVSSYNVYRSTVSGTELAGTAIASPSVTSFSDVSASNGTQYWYEVTAVNGTGEGPASNEVSATPTAANPPDAPTGLSAAPSAKKGVSLSWVAPANSGGSAITGYRISRSTSSGTETLLTSVGATPTTYNDNSARRGVTYFYVVAAVNAVGAGSPSNEASAAAK